MNRLLYIMCVNVYIYIRKFYFLSFTLSESFTTVLFAMHPQISRLHYYANSRTLYGFFVLLLFSTRRRITIYLWRPGGSGGGQWYKVIANFKLQQKKTQNKSNLNACIIVYTMFLITPRKVVIKFNHARGGKENAAATQYIKAFIYILLLYIRMPYI